VDVPGDMFAESLVLAHRVCSRSEDYISDFIPRKREGSDIFLRQMSYFV